jgi:hypothetical protein
MTTLPRRFYMLNLLTKATAQLCFLWLLVVFPTISFSQSVKIGRSQLLLPDFASWTITEVKQQGIAYTGDASGNIPVESKRFIYRSTDDLVKANIVSAVTLSAVGIQMSWSNSCQGLQAHEHLFIHDLGGMDRQDCLLVLRLDSTYNFLNRAQNLKNVFGEPLPHTIGGYYIEYNKGLSNGAYTSTNALIASDFIGSDEKSFEQTHKIPQAVIRWALDFSKANGRAVTGFTGHWELPPLKFNKSQN